MTPARTSRAERDSQPRCSRRAAEAQASLLAEFVAILVAVVTVLAAVAVMLVPAQRARVLRLLRERRRREALQQRDASRADAARAPHGALDGRTATKGRRRISAMVCRCGRLAEENVKTLPHDIFDRIDQLAAPRSSNTGSRTHDHVPEEMPMMAPAPMGMQMRAASGRRGADLGVKIEAQFTVVNTRSSS